MQNIPVKTMNKNVNSSCDSGIQRQCKKAKKDDGSELSTQGQKVDVKDQAVEKKTYPLGPDRSAELTPTMHGCYPEAQSTHDSHPSHQHLMGSSVDEDDKGDFDLYRDEEEIEKELQQKYQSKPEHAGESQSSVSAPEDIQTYSEREWKGNTSKSRLIRKGYDNLANKFTLRRVRGDNYCALRATLFQVLSLSKQLPAWLEESDITEWPKRVNSDGDLIKEWRFPYESRKSKVEMLEQCLNRLRKRWHEAVECKSLQERERMCQQVFIGQEEEYELLEALKFLMLRTAIQLNAVMTNGSEVPEFCWLLFARDSSKCPKSLLTNHLRHVGFNGGLEQVEMCLLGHSLQQTIQVYRLYKSDTEEFITYYPNDHQEDWPSLCLLTEDDRHYNALVPKRSTNFDECGRPIWKQPSDGQSHFTTRL
ncbi:OTU deubiquitinase with linear linkage specificity b isoform X2 [Triplophysa dalaica]|uniref:OTU deubiquitinase with linear linkage specificity b isoform X2 n=1 Tax=Triplophysa dalaica TaxID=1582913 RepID=UPI0024DF5456|nr:OTU deubiquitinase with linear linkage specificity b isoform X2 [Triplophysa dalaica]